MSETHYERPAFRASSPAAIRSEYVSPGLRADDPELAAFLENLYARNLPESEEAQSIRHFVQMRQRRDAA
jgi:hypothetical protein